MASPGGNDLPPDSDARLLFNPSNARLHPDAAGPQLPSPPAAGGAAAAAATGLTLGIGLLSLLAALAVRKRRGRGEGSAGMGKASVNSEEEKIKEGFLPGKGDSDGQAAPGVVASFLLFFYSCFLKPYTRGAFKKQPGGHNGGASQQDALESFYAAQAGVYDVTRGVLLKGREDMLALIAAQVKARVGTSYAQEGPLDGGDGFIWVDIGGGTGWNIEAMAKHLDVPCFFSAVYLVDFSPSLCAVARKRFARLGWANVRVVCQDARKFRLEDYEQPVSHGSAGVKRPRQGADVITMSYSLSMIPDYFSVVDSLTSLISPRGIMGVVDFYAQSQSEFSFRNFTAGTLGRHVSYLARTFWRAWFDLDRVQLEPARRDYLEYRFGTVLGVNLRNRTLGYIPYHVWIGRPRQASTSLLLSSSSGKGDGGEGGDLVEYIDALATCTEPSSLASSSSSSSSTALPSAPSGTAHSKAFAAAVDNLASGLPLPAFFYQNHHWRLYYDDSLPKHTQFGNEYIYAFTWEDARVDDQLLCLGPADVVLAITSAGDNVLSYLRRAGPGARIHAVDLNPTQNHLLELKVAACAAGVPYDDFWMLFGEGRHERFRDLLLDTLSPHLSSRAFQYWLRRVNVFAGASGGLYDTGGSRHAIRCFRWVATLLGLGSDVDALLSAGTLDRQRSIWRGRIRPALLSRLLSSVVVSQEAFLWAALGVPGNQLAMIEADHGNSEAVCGPSPTSKNTRSHAVWRYMVDTLDPVAEHTHIASDNPYYRVCMRGRFARGCCPDYLSPESFDALARPGALDGLRIHTDELSEVLARLAPGSLTVAVVMDSMDWFDRARPADAAAQAAKLNRALAVDGRVLLRSAGLRPWYIAEFEKNGFGAERVGVRRPGQLVDRVNMYASCWVCTKIGNLPPPTPETES